MKKFKSTIWLDFYTYIFIPFIILSNTFNYIKYIMDLESLKTSSYFIIILEPLLIILWIYSLLQFFKMNKKAFYLFKVTIISMVFVVLFNAFVNDSDILLILSFMLFYIVAWIIPNYIYINKRKEIFSNSKELTHYHKCLKCKRLISINDSICPECSKKDNC